ncbi:TPA: chromosome partitioning protein ParB, partial [Legionella pneumophila]
TILAEQVGAPVQIVNDGEDGGWLKVKFFDNDTLAGLLERLGLRYD